MGLPVQVCISSLTPEGSPMQITTCTGEGRIHAAIMGDGDGGIHACSWVPWDDG